MASKCTVVCILYLQVVNSEYYNVPAPNYPSYSHKYAPTTTIQAVPTFAPTFANTPPKQPVKSLKRSVSTPPKASQQTATAYFLSAPSEKVKATVLPREKLNEKPIPTPTYSCPMCNGFADVPPNPKIAPPPLCSPVLPGIIEHVPTIVFPILATKEPISIVSVKAPAPLFPDMYEKHKLPENLSFDQELLDGFLTGLGLASYKYSL